MIKLFKATCTHSTLVGEPFLRVTASPLLRNGILLSISPATWKIQHFQIALQCDRNFSVPMLQWYVMCWPIFALYLTQIARSSNNGYYLNFPPICAANYRVGVSGSQTNVNDAKRKRMPWLPISHRFGAKLISV